MSPKPVDSRLQEAVRQPLGVCANTGLLLKDCTCDHMEPWVIRIKPLLKAEVSKAAWKG